VAVEDAPSSGALISGKSQADRFLMGLLRAAADAVLIGAGTLRATPGHLWTAQHVYPSLTRDWQQLRQAMGKAADPRLVVLTASGELDGSHPALQRGALVLTTAAGARRARAGAPGGCEVRVVGRGRQVSITRALDLLRSLGYAAVLSEAGGVVMGQLVRERCVDELFLTVSPVLAGRVRGDGNKGLVEGFHLLPGAAHQMRLAGARRHQSHLFLRYSWG
jgi:riboflavin biosynthesis pyrimidine reductase